MYTFILHAIESWFLYIKLNKQSIFKSLFFPEIDGRNLFLETLDVNTFVNVKDDRLKKKGFIPGWRMKGEKEPGKIRREAP